MFPHGCLCTPCKLLISLSHSKLCKYSCETSSRPFQLGTQPATHVDSHAYVSACNHTCKRTREHTCHTRTRACLVTEQRQKHWWLVLASVFCAYGHRSIATPCCAVNTKRACNQQPKQAYGVDARRCRLDATTNSNCCLSYRCPDRCERCCAETYAVRLAHVSMRVRVCVSVRLRVDFMSSSVSVSVCIRMCLYDDVSVSAYVCKLCS